VTIRSNATRGAAAVAALILLAGTVLAADPSASPSASMATASASAGSSASPGASPVASAGTAPTASEQARESEPPDESEPPEAAEAPDTTDGPPSAAQITQIVGLLKGAGITATAAQVEQLAAAVGLGGAVRVLAFAQASGKTPAQILALFQSGKGWGEIDHELGLTIGPGIGWIMGQGHGKGHANPKP